MKELIDVACQPKVMVITGAIAMTIGGAIRNDDLCLSGLIIVVLAFAWGVAQAMNRTLG